MLMGGNSHGPINDPEEYALAEIQPMKVGEMAVVMGPLYLVPPHSLPMTKPNARRFWPPTCLRSGTVLSQ